MSFSQMKIPKVNQQQYPAMPETSFTTAGIFQLLHNLNINKSSGPDQISAIVLKNCGLEISPILQVIFTQSMSTGILPNDWLLANIMHSNI